MAEEARKLYRIRDWDKHFENNESRKRKRIHWVPIPNSHDGYFYRRTLEEPNGMILYAAWIGILTLASRCDVRGTLARSCGKFLTSADICRLTGMNRETIEAALTFFSQTLDAIEVIENLPESADVPADLPKSAVRREEKRREEKGREEKGKERKRREGDEPVESWESVCQLGLLPELNTEPMRLAWETWTEHRHQIKKRLTPAAVKMQVKQFNEWGEAYSIHNIQRAVRNGWTGIHADDSAGAPGPKASRIPTPDELKRWNPHDGGGLL